MCAFAGGAFLWASMLATAAAGAYSADASKNMGRYQQQVAEQNAELSEFKAQQAATIGSVQEERMRSRARQMVGQQRAAIAANGVEVGSGTALDLVSETALFGEEDALMTRFNAMNEAWGLRAQAVDYRNEGRAARTRGQNEATGTYLTTGANMASSYYNYRAGKG